MVNWSYVSPNGSRYRTGAPRNVDTSNAMIPMIGDRDDRDL